MVMLTVLVCLSAEPARCAWVSIPGPASVMGCALGGRAVADAWAAEHPGWFVHGWRCGRRGGRS
ncbi:hypothetical protein OHA_1_03976 [Pleomorphomonas sp. SM30]|uniref:Uncharacterized protein n=1 Tax=Oharaeibacter diazotrophicus TaxID=1920512 RepID=A0A4R6RGV9_9HYPH|nr:hypothetical protein [Oharaeibacter diazotrophicus]TDP85375.1 hypothetical protein EDD54_2228 [Oharaeibacter diazotrophicus]BBE74345.1 hypothetical protein OHA_1_03976 [Pleomorphomonas sp. SM30]GLS75962.1 hypothetical protein GCM10007904_12970 [Oharaeibacter diazotrophicus]